jgi:hypothetical protein
MHSDRYGRHGYLRRSERAIAVGSGTRRGPRRIDGRYGTAGATTVVRAVRK